MRTRVLHPARAAYETAENSVPPARNGVRPEGRLGSAMGRGAPHSRARRRRAPGTRRWRSAFGSGRGIRTLGLQSMSLASYRTAPSRNWWPTCASAALVGQGGFEPPTPRLSSVHSTAELLAIRRFGSNNVSPSRDYFIHSLSNGVTAHSDTTANFLDRNSLEHLDEVEGRPINLGHLRRSAGW